jgi:hypothetical protein
MVSMSTTATPCVKSGMRRRSRLSVESICAGLRDDQVVVEADEAREHDDAGQLT